MRKNNGGHWNALIYVASFCQADAARILIAEGADVNAKDTHGSTALMWAAGKSHIDRDCSDTVKALLTRGTDITVKDKESGKTTLMYAKEADHTQIVEILEQAGARE